MAMIRGVVCMLVCCIAIVGCDSFPGPVLRNEFPIEINVSILYADGTSHSEVWAPCRTVYIGASEVGRFGMRSKDVAVDEITIEVDHEVVHRFDKETIEDLHEKANEKRGHLIWILDRSGVRFSSDRECSLDSAQQQ